MSMDRNASQNLLQLEWISDALVYLGIAATFGVVSIICCGIWLLIW